MMNRIIGLNDTGVDILVKDNGDMYLVTRDEREVHLTAKFSELHIFNGGYMVMNGLTGEYVIVSDESGILIADKSYFVHGTTVYIKGAVITQKDGILTGDTATAYAVDELRDTGYLDDILDLMRGYIVVGEDTCCCNQNAEQPVTDEDVIEGFLHMFY